MDVKPGPRRLWERDGRPRIRPIWFVPVASGQDPVTLAVPVQNPPDPAMVAAPWSLPVQAVARPQPRPDLEALALTWCIAVSPWTELHHQARPDLKPCCRTCSV
ncbi:hypothetical protein ZWY2020_050778 [Hordeum vulgare]|nr:hypothetical protein ZWY2020_050778 [Hordeum vulgare]